EAIVRHRFADVPGDLARLVERTTDEQHRELVSADARHGIRVAHFLLEQRRDLSQQVVARNVPAGVVDELEIVEIEIADDVPYRVGASRCERGLEPPLELRTVHEPGQRIVRRLIRHLASKAANLADVVENDHATGDLTVRSLYGGCRELGRELSIGDLAHQERTAAEIHSPALDEALIHRVPERRAIDLVDERDQVAEPLPDRDGPRDPDQLLGRL